MDETDRLFAGSPVEFVGPFEHHAVVMHGRKVPFLTATPIPGGIVHLTLDDRFGLDVAVQDADRVVGFIADCIAVAMGYTCHPLPEWDGPIRREPFTRMRSLDPVAD